MADYDKNVRFSFIILLLVLTFCPVVYFALFHLTTHKRNVDYIQSLYWIKQQIKFYLILPFY